MNCPQCDQEMADVVSPAGEHVWICSDCGQWLDGTDLNAMLLRANLPGVASLGGKRAPDEATGTCSTCRVDLARLTHRDGASYELCEDCGWIFLPLDPPAAEDFEAAHARLLQTVRGFLGKKPGASR